jgi:vacuolar-type H+-ATPase subunit E/Vma4
MPDQEEKLHAFTQTALREANRDAHRIKEELKAEHDRAIASVHAQYKAEISRWREARAAEARSAEMRRVNSVIAENRRAMLDYRESCAKDVFDALPERIRVFTESAEYPSHMRRLLRRAHDAIGGSDPMELYLREADMGLADALRGALPDAEITVLEGNFRLGGLCLYCPKKHVRADLSFDSAIADMVGHFSELSGMEMN